MTASAISPFDPSSAANAGYPLLPQNIVLEGPAVLQRSRSCQEK